MQSWNAVFMEMAKVIALRSKDRTKVGAVIVDARNRVTSVGFNGLPHTCDAFAERDILAGDDPDVDRLDAVVHAEQNAILFARGDLVGQTLYCTHHPCVRCASIICQSGIVRVVYGDGSLKSDHKTDAAKRLFYHCGVRLENGV